MVKYLEQDLLFCSISESDRRIQEIMNRVMSRGMSQKTDKIEEKSEEEGNSLKYKRYQNDSMD